jgi:hypothetical protein
VNLLLAAPLRSLCSRKARIGATPVPGPTRITGVSGSGGKKRVGGLILSGTLVPSIPVSLL